MHLRLDVLALKIKIARLLNLGFSLIMIFFCQTLIDTYSFQLIGVHLGFIVWIFIGIYVYSGIDFNSSIASQMDDAEDKFFDIKEFIQAVKRDGGTEELIKLQRFIASVSDVFLQAKIDMSQQPKIFISKAVDTSRLSQKQQEAQAFGIFHTGLGKGKVIVSPVAAILKDELTQDQMSYVLAHELGHSIAEAMMHMSFALVAGRAIKQILKFFFILAIPIGITTGSWVLLFTLLGMFIFDGFISNVVFRLEEFYADSYATSLGFGKGGDKLFNYLESKGIGTFPSFLEIFVNHPTYKNRLANNKAIQTDDQGIIPDVLERWLYALGALAMGTYIFTVAPQGFALVTVLLFVGSIGGLIALCNSEIVPKTAFYYAVRTINLVLGLILTYFAANIFALPALAIWALVLSAFFIFAEAVLNKSNAFLNTLGGYTETAVFFFYLIAVLQILGYISILPHLL